MIVLHTRNVCNFVYEYFCFGLGVEGFKKRYNFNFLRS
jgi:hypothetical protein